MLITGHSQKCSSGRVLTTTSKLTNIDITRICLGMRLTILHLGFQKQEKQRNSYKFKLVRIKVKMIPSHKEVRVQSYHGERQK